MLWKCGMFEGGAQLKTEYPLPLGSGTDSKVPSNPFCPLLWCKYGNDDVSARRYQLGPNFMELLSTQTFA